jgi:hypothetical protein
MPPVAMLDPPGAPAGASKDAALDAFASSRLNTASIGDGNLGAAALPGVPSGPREATVGGVPWAPPSDAGVPGREAADGEALLPPMLPPPLVVGSASNLSNMKGAGCELTAGQDR